jgi:signal transduction histidine kinase
MNRFDRVLLIRHLAIVAGAVAAYLLRSELQIGYTALAIVGAGAWLNVGAYVFRTRESLAKLCLVASPIIGIGSWGALSAVTNGVFSPFTLGLFLEVVLAPMHLAARGIVFVTLGAVGALWLQQSWNGFAGAELALLLRSGFLLGMGAAIYGVQGRWQRTHEELAQQSSALSDRLEGLERQLADERPLTMLGESAARLAHGHKNAVHSLRGFVSLIEPLLAESKGRAALEGLKAAIDDLERLALLTLESGRREVAPAPNAAACRARGEIASLLRELEISHPGSRWELRADGADPELALRASEFVEVMRCLITNSIEAMHGEGRGSVELSSAAGMAVVSIRDEGDGIDPADAERIFERGYTTKRGGSGFGLYLARKIVLERGGRIDVRAGEPRGAVFELRLPLAGDRLARAGARA